MSFAEQERALLDLVFDDALRAAFVADGAAALGSYDLTEGEREDFRTIDSFGLETDARMRRELILHRLCRSLPLTFSIASSLPGGLDVLGGLVHPGYAKTATPLRTLRYGQAVRLVLASTQPADARVHALSLAVVDAELGLAQVAAELRESVAAGATVADAGALALTADWDQKPLAFAPHVCVALLPRSHAELTQLLCPAGTDSLWARLSAAPLPPSRLAQVFAREAPRLLLGRAVALRASRCELTVTHQLMELSDGFAPLLRQLGDRPSVVVLLAHLQRAGAKGPLLDGVRAALRQMLERGLLRAA